MAKKPSASSIFIYEKVGDHLLVLRNLAYMIRELQKRESDEDFPEKIIWPLEPDQASKDAHLYYVRTQGRVTFREILERYQQLQPEMEWTTAKMRAAFEKVRNWNSMMFMKKAMDSGIL